MEVIVLWIFLLNLVLSFNLAECHVISCYRLILFLSSELLVVKEAEWHQIRGWSGSPFHQTST